MYTGTNTMFYIPESKVPRNRKVPYINPVASIRSNKAEIYRVRLTPGRDRLDYPGITATETVSLTTIIVHLNSVIFTQHAKICTVDIKYFYYGTRFTRYEYLCVHISMISN